MNNETRIFIDDLADKVRDAYNIKTPVMDIEEIVKKIGGTIVEENIFDDICEGSILKTGDSTFNIRIWKYEKEDKRKYILARELGHLFLHMGFRTDNNIWNKQSLDDYRLFGSSEQSYQANEFACALFMPYDEYICKLDEFTNDNKSVNISKVAEYFHVSDIVALNRGLFCHLLL